MSIFVKVAVGLLLTLPLGAYVAGTLVASQASMPEERAPIVVEATPSSSTTTAGPSRTPRPSPTHATPDDRGGDDRGSDDGRHDDSDGVKVVRPSPHEVEDDREDRADEAEDAADEAEDAAEDAADEAEDAEEDAQDSDDGSGDD